MYISESKPNLRKMHAIPVSELLSASSEVMMETVSTSQTLVNFYQTR
jgi:hypothetical protein